MNESPSQSTTTCGHESCGKSFTQPQSGRRKRFCSDACRVRVHRRYETPRPSNHQGLRDKTAVDPLSAKNASFVTSKINDLADPQNRSSAVIAGPDYVIQAAVIDARDWEEVASSDGVVSYVSRIGQRALREGDQ